MNARKSKAIRKLSYQILYDWIRFECLSEEERNTMKPIVDSEVKKDMMSMIPKQTHYFHQQTLHLSAWTLKWVQKKDFGLVSMGIRVTRRRESFSRGVPSLPSQLF